MIKNSSSKLDFLEAIDYEMHLENKRREVIKGLKHRECNMDFQIIKRIISLFNRMIKKFRKDFDLIKEYLKFCIMINSYKSLYKVFLKNLKYFTQNLNYWLILISYEFEERKNIF